ncbi:MAG: beta-N-acetylhexosaminidase [Deltaproteobacteria bacterium]|nr:beta-N-acetylhexosaminidase [Deltaproteobacteria bacterium]
MVSELEQLAGSVMVCGFPGVEAPSEIRSWLADDSVAGLILFKRNIDDVQQTAELITSCTATQDPSLPILVCVDQEGGRVARFGDPILKLPAMRKLAEAADPELTTSAGAVLACQLRAIGINLDFAPVLDVDTNPDNPVIGDRAFGSTPQVVIEHALAFADGLHAGGVLSCGKHFPGHGDTDLDSHLALPTLRHDRERLEHVELPPFRAAVGRLPSIMTAHVVFDAFDSAPATISHRVIVELLRNEIGYDGVVFTDDLEMKALSALYPIEESGLLAIEAGCDILLICSDLEAAGKLREALAREADRHQAFRDKLEEARSRADALRQRVTTLPPPMSLENALDHAKVRALWERLGQLE